MIGYAAFGALSTMVIVALVTAGLYLIGTSLAGTCLGYRMMGISTCPVAERAA